MAARETFPVAIQHALRQGQREMRSTAPWAAGGRAVVLTGSPNTCWSRMAARSLSPQSPSQPCTAATDPAPSAAASKVAALCSGWRWKKKKGVEEDQPNMRSPCQASTQCALLYMHMWICRCMCMLCMRACYREGGRQDATTQEALARLACKGTMDRPPTLGSLFHDSPAAVAKPG